MMDTGNTNSLNVPPVQSTISMAFTAHVTGLKFVALFIQEGMIMMGNIMPLKHARSCATDQLNAPAARSVLTKLARKVMSPAKNTAFEKQIRTKFKRDAVLMPKRTEANAHVKKELINITLIQANALPANT